MHTVRGARVCVCDCVCVCPFLSVSVRPLFRSTVNLCYFQILMYRTFRCAYFGLNANSIIIFLTEWYVMYVPFRNTMNSYVIIHSSVTSAASAQISQCLPPQMVKSRSISCFQVYMPNECVPNAWLHHAVPLEH